MKAIPSISIILPTYNRAHTVGKAISSVLHQTYQDFELIVVDDGSTDATQDCVRDFNDKRIIYVRHEHNRGAGAAKNTGVLKAKGRYIAFQDSDDEWFPEKLEKQMHIFDWQPSEFGVVYTGAWKIENNIKTYIPEHRISKKEGDIHPELLRKNFVTIHVLMRTECIARAGLFDERLLQLEDWDLWIRISKYYKFKFIDEPLVYIYQMQDSVTKDVKAYKQASEFILEKYFDEYTHAGRKILAERYYAMGSILYNGGDYKRGRRYIRKAIRTCPYHVPYLLAYFNRLLGMPYSPNVNR